MLHNLSPLHLSRCLPLTPTTRPPYRHPPSSTLPLTCLVSPSLVHSHPLFLRSPPSLLFFPPTLRLCSAVIVTPPPPSLSSPPAWWCGGQVQGRSRESSQTQLWGNASGPAAVLQTPAAQETVLPAGTSYLFVLCVYVFSNKTAVVCWTFTDGWKVRRVCI